MKSYINVELNSRWVYHEYRIDKIKISRNLVDWALLLPSKPLQYACLMKFAQTFQSGKLISNIIFNHAYRTLLYIAILAHTVLFRSNKG